jgi:selenocysteine lyase/cysteine desulfurase
MINLEQYFEKYRKNIIGNGQTFQSPYGEKEIIYTDWTASGRLYRPIEELLLNELGPYVANTHTETSFTGAVMTHAYHKSKDIIKKHVHADEDDVLILSGTGMTSAINKFQRLLGLRIPDLLKSNMNAMVNKPVVFITHMEHHSNQTSWLETIADVVVIPYDETGLVDYIALENLFQHYQDRSLKIASITACSNVTGIINDYHRIARIAHENNGLCFVDFACSAPYVQIDMHPNEAESLDAIFFSPHKFLGGPGTQGVLIFNKKLYRSLVPDNPGGGTVTFTNPWGKHDYVADIETREDGGTPGFLQSIKTALSIRLKEEMSVQAILDREHELNVLIFKELEQISNLHILAAQHKKRMGIFSFYIDDAHFNLIVKLLNDRFGIQTRGGCSCAGTYGHFLLNIDNKTSEDIENDVLKGKFLTRPGWVRMSIHPTMTDVQVLYVCNCIRQVAENHNTWGKDYDYVVDLNDYIHQSQPKNVQELVNSIL